MTNHSHSNPSKDMYSVVAEGITYILLFAITFLFLPILGNPFDVPKFLSVIVGGSIIALLWIVKAIRQKSLAMHFDPPQIAISTIAVIIAVSGYVQKVFAINILPSTFGVMALLIIIALLLSEILIKPNTKRFTIFLYSFGIVLTILSFLQAMSFGVSSIVNKMFSISLPENFLFSPTGSTLVTMSVLLTLLFSIVVTLWQVFQRSKKVSSHIFEVIAGVIITAGVVFHGYLFFTNDQFRPQILPFSANWSVAADTLKTPKELFLGFGPTRFSDAYTAKRPVTLNNTPHWNIVYQIGTNAPLSMMVSIGIVATVAWFILAGYLLLTVPRSSAEAQPAGWITLGAMGVQMILPPNIVLLAIQFLALAFFLASSQKHEHDQSGNVINFALKMLQGKKSAKSQTPASLLGLYLGAGALGAVTLFVLFSTFTIISAEYYFYQSGKAFRENKASQAYELQKKAITINPYNDGYHRTYAQTNLTLATAISQKKDITDDDRKTIAQLLQQAIRESRAAASINPYRSQNWRTMATVYRSLVGSTKGADQWTVAAYNQAIQTAPNDPTLRIDLGGLFYFAKNYEVAEQLFQQSVILKPDYANGYYNLAKARESGNKLPGAVLAYQQVLRLVDQSSDDYITAQKELTQLVDKVKAEQERQAKLQPTVTPTPEPKKDEPKSEPQAVELPKEAQQDATILDKEPENPQLATESGTLNQ